MKSRYIANKAEYERIAQQAAREELQRQKQQLCPDCEKNIMYQSLAVVFWILHRDHRHTPEWLNRFKAEIECEYRAMELPPLLGQAPYSANVLIQKLKDMGVDFETSIFDDKE